MQMKRSREEKEGESSLGGRDRKFLWFLSLPPKVKSFMWRNCLGILPTNELLWKRHMRFDGVCPGCMTEVETIAHVLWSCPVANDIWLQSRLTVHKWDPVVNFFDLMELVCSRLERNEVELFCCIAYFIWG
jgi:hypothetical protein